MTIDSASQAAILSRRSLLRTSGIAATAAMIAPRSLMAKSAHPLAQTPGLVEKARNNASSDKITIQHLRGNISVLMGAGGNIAVLTGHDGKLLIDAGFAGAKPAISDALASLGPDPIKHLINTHWHFDHTDGNAWVHAAGATILAHENTRKHLSTDTLVDGWDFTFKAAPAGAIPTQTFSSEHAVELKGETIGLKHYAPAHTDSDISVHFTHADVFHTGDIWWNGYYPFLDYSTGGSIDGTIQAAETTLKQVTDKMILIPGHGPVADKAQLAHFRDVMVDIRTHVAAMKKQGKPLPEIIAAKPTAAYDAKWGGGFMSPSVFTALVYEGV
jgi:glyoxylase-like metal-dependent hydrolase (beta-lactamase superfamily II)